MASTKQDDGAIGLYIGFAMMLVPIAILFYKRPPHLGFRDVLPVAIQILFMVAAMGFAQSKLSRRLELSISVEFVIVAWSLMLAGLDGYLAVMFTASAVLGGPRKLVNVTAEDTAEKQF